MGEPTMSEKQLTNKQKIDKGIFKIDAFGKSYKCRYRKIEEITTYIPSDVHEEDINKLVKWAINRGVLDDDELVMELRVSKIRKPIVLLDWERSFKETPPLKDVILTYKGQKGWAIPEKKFLAQLEDEIYAES